MKKAPLKSSEGGEVLLTDFLFQIQCYVPLPMVTFPSFSTKLRETCLAGCSMCFRINPLRAKASFWVRSMELLNSVTLNSKWTITRSSSNTNWASANAQINVETKKVQGYFIFQPFSYSGRVASCQLPHDAN